MPDGTVGSSASALQNRDSVAEVFEAKKQVGLEGLSKEIQEALKGVEGEPGEIVERIKSLAESKADEVRGSLDQMHAVLQQEGGKINTEVSGISEAIQSLNDDTRRKIEDALERFQMELARAVIETKPKREKTEKEMEVDAIDKEIEALQDRVDDLERKKKQNEKDKGEPPLSPEEEVELVAKQAEVDQLEAKSRKLAGKPEGTAPSPDTSVSTATPVVAEAVKAPGVSASFAEAARKIQEKNAAEAEAKLGSFIDGLIEKARKERTKHATVFSGSEAQQKIAADRFEADKSILSARHLLHFVEGDKRTRRVDADDPSGEDELVVYQAAPSGFSEKGVLNLARNKFGYSGEDGEVLKNIRKKAQEQLSSEKEGGTGDFAQGVAAVEKRVEGREELGRIKQELDSFGADPSDREKERIRELKARREEVLAALAGVSFKSASKKGAEGILMSGTGDLKNNGERPSSSLTEAERDAWGARLKEHQALVSAAEALRSQWESSTEIDAGVEGWLQWGRSLVEAERVFLDSKTQDEYSARGGVLLEVLKKRPTNAKALDTVIQKTRGDADRLETDAAKGIGDKQAADAAQTFVEDHFNKRTDAYNKVKIKKEKIDAMIAELEAHFGVAAVPSMPAESSPDASVSTAAPDTAPPTPETPSPVELFSDAEKKEMEEKMVSGEKVLGEARSLIDVLKSADATVLMQKHEVEWAEGALKQLAYAHKDLVHAKTEEEKAKAVGQYELAKSIIGEQTQQQTIIGIRDGLAKALKGVSDRVLTEKTPEAQQQEQVLRNYAIALKSLMGEIGRHVPEIASIALDVPEPTVIPPEPTPDPVAPPGVDAPPTPDKPPSAPEAAGSFEQVVAEDEARLAEVKKIMAEWGNDKGERPPQDADIQRVVDAYEGVINAERAYINAEKESERKSLEKKMKDADKALPKASALLNQLMEDFRRYASKAEGPDGYAGKEKWGPAWKAKVDVRIAALNILSETLKKVDAPAKAPKPVEAAPATPAAPSSDAPKAPTPDAAPTPPATPDAPKAPDSSSPAAVAEDEGTQYGPRTLEGEVSHETDLLGRIDALLEKMRRTKDLDDADTETAFGDLGEVLIRAQEGMELLEGASKEADDIKRQDLFVKRDVILKDPAILAKAEAYMRKMVEFMRNASTEEMEEDVEIEARIEAFELVSELFPSLRAKVGDLKREKQEAAVLEFPERAEWQAWISKNKQQIEAVKRAVGSSADEAWYKEAKERIEKSLVFQEGVIARTEAVLAAKTSAQRQQLSKELWEFRRQVHAMPMILPGETPTGVQAKIDKLEKEYGQLKDEGDEGKRKKAQEEKRAKIEKLKHLLAVVRLDENLFLESDLHVTSTDDAIAAHVQKRREQNAMRNPGETRVSESPEDIHKDLESAAGNEHEELRELVAVGKAMRKLFSEARSAYAPHEDTGKTFAPIYEGWKEEQEASFELLDVQRRRGFNNHLEVWATRGLRTLDQLDGNANLTDEAWEALTNSEGAERMFGEMTLDKNERNVGAIKARLYDVIRKVTQSKIKMQEEYAMAKKHAESLAGTTRAKLEAAGEELEATLEKTSLELKQLSSKIETMQGPPEKGGNPVRWKREGDQLLARESILRYAQQNAADRKADYDELLEALTEKAESSSNDAEEIVLPFALQEGVNTRLAAIMKKQTERGQTTEKVRAQAAQAVYKANPRMMDVEIRTTSSAAMGGDVKRESIGGGTAPKGAYESFKGTWAGKLMSPFLSVFEGLFK